MANEVHLPVTPLTHLPTSTPINGGIHGFRRKPKNADKSAAPRKNFHLAEVIGKKMEKFDRPLFRSEKIA